MTELLPHVAAFLAVATPARPWPTLTPSEARAQLRAGQRPDVGAPDVPTSDQSIRGRGGNMIPLRIYGGKVDSPVLVFLHGGGWVYGDLDMADGFCRRLCDSADVTVVSVDYRLSPEAKYPLALDDASDAIDWANATFANGRRIGVVGSSAGGNLAIAACIRIRDAGAGPGGIGLHVPMCAVTDHRFDTSSYAAFADGLFLTAEDMRWYWGHYLGDPQHGDEPTASVLRADLHDMPPALVITAELDPLRDEAESYAARLVEAGGTAVVQRFDGMIHAFPVLTAFPVEQAAVIAAIGDAVDSVLR